MGSVRVQGGNEPFPIQKLKQVWAKRKRALRPDGLTSQYLSNNTTEPHIKLLALFNDIWELATQADSFTLADVCPILKSRKPPDRLDSHRRIVAHLCRGEAPRNDGAGEAGVALLPISRVPSSRRATSTTTTQPTASRTWYGLSSKRRAATQ